MNPDDPFARVLRVVYGVDDVWDGGLQVEGRRDLGGGLGVLRACIEAGPVLYWCHEVAFIRSFGAQRAGVGGDGAGGRVRGSGSRACGVRFV